MAFPLAAIITAQSLSDYFENKDNTALYRIISPAILFLMALVLIIVLVLIMFIFRSGLLPLMMWSSCAVMWVYFACSKQLPAKVFWLPVIAMMITNVFITNFVYPALLQYQLGSQVGRFIQREHIPSSAFIFYKVSDPLNSLSFYAQQTLHGSEAIAAVKTKQYVLTMDEGMDTLLHSGYNFDIIKQGQFFKVSELTPEFLNPATRANTLKNYYLLKMQ